MASETVTVYIDDASLRIMVVQGKRIQLWAESPLPSGLVEDNVIVKEAELAALLMQLFDVQDIKTRRVNLGMSGIRCLTRFINLPKLPKDMLDEAIRRELARSLDVPSRLDEVYLSWQQIPSKEGQTRVFSVGIEQKTVDAMFRVLKLAGLKVGFLEIKPLLLARLVKETAAVLIDVQSTELDIVVVFERIPQRIRSARFASGNLSSEERLTTVKNELNRNLSFYNTLNPDKPLDKNVPIYVSGNLANDPASYNAIAAEAGHPVSPLASPFDCPESFDVSHYSANIGLAASTILPAEKGGGTAVTLNALPASYRTRAVSLTNVVALPAAVVAILLVVFLFLYNQNISAEISAMKTRITDTNKSIQQKQIQQNQLTKQVNDLQKKLNTENTTYTGLSTVVNNLENQASALNNDLSAALKSLPASVNMSTLNHIDNVLTITGRSPTEAFVLSYITKLDDTGRFGSITITDMTRADDGNFDFTLVGTVQAQSVGASSLEVALGSLPTAVTLTNVTSSEGLLNIQGFAQTSEKVFAYLRALEASGKFSEITVASLEGDATVGMKFTLILKTGG